jgi:hypothetical protein
MFRSGQFYWLGGISWEWRDISSAWRPSSTPGWKANDILLVPNAIATLTMMIEFAARLAQSGAVSTQIQLEVVLGRTSGRTLISDEWFLRENRTANVEQVTIKLETTQTDLIARSSAIALDIAARIFRMFRWSPTREVLEGIQQNVNRR